LQHDPQLEVHPDAVAPAARDVAPILADIAAALRRPSDLQYKYRSEPVALGAREPGWALYLAHLWRATQKPSHRALALRHLERAIDGVPDASDLPFFGHGFTGTAWAVEHLSPWCYPSDGDANAEVDDALLLMTERATNPPFDLQYGLVGFGLYALERLPRPSATRLLERVLLRLEQLSERSGDGLFWRVPPVWNMSGDASLGAIASLGVANGAAGVVALAAEAHRRGVARPRARRLIEGGLAWIWSQRLGRGAASTFPLHSSTERGSPWPWAVGDLGIVSVMLRAARTLGLDAYEARALRLARGLARRTARASRLRDPSLSLGAAGVAHMFGRLYRSTGEPLFARAAADWLAHLLRLRRPGRGTAGFAVYVPKWQRKLLADPDYPTGWIGLPGFWNGVAGIGLALLAASVPGERGDGKSAAGDDGGAGWDRALLLF
jgi:lantibiotic biosynthesis protein